MTTKFAQLSWWSVVVALALSTAFLPTGATAQDEGQQDDPPTRVARLGYMEGSVSFQPAGETDWVEAVANRPMTTGDRLWADKGSRAELQLGSAVIRLSENTGVSFLNLDDHTVQIQLSSGTINLRVRRLDPNDDFEVDTPDLAFTVSQAGNYRLDASEDGTYTTVSLRDGGGQATGNGQTYTLHDGQRATFSGGTDSLNAEVEGLGGLDQFDNWADGRDHRDDNSPSAQYVSRDVVGYEDLDDNGSWRDDKDYGHVWYPNNVAAGWAPYREGHWDWISPWGYTWVDDSAWGYAPFHYGRWVTVGGRWGWIAGPVNVRPVYAPALVVFIGGGGVGVGIGGDVGWFPLGPREVYVPPYQVSRGYMNRVNVSNTTVNSTTITNVYNTTIINNRTTNITNVNYVNRNVRGAVTVVPQHTFAGAQPVARVAVAVNPQQIAKASISARGAVAPTQQSVLGAKASTANRVTAPPAAVMNRQVVAKRTPPAPPVPFAKQQQALAAHPGQPLAKRDIQNLSPPAAAAAHPMVKVAPPGKPATPTTGHPGNPPKAGRPGQPPPPPASQPANRPPNQQAPQQRPATTQEQNRPPVAQPPSRPTAPSETNRAPTAQPNHPPVAQPPNRPATTPNQPPPRPQTPPAKPTQTSPAESNRPPATPPNRPETNRPAPPPPTNRSPAAQPQNHPATPTETNRQATPPPPANRPPAAQPNRPEAKPNQPPPVERQPQRTPPPAAAKPSPPQPHQQPNLTPEQKKQEEERQKQEKPPGA